jgi:antitoxin MazE
MPPRHENRPMLRLDIPHSRRYIVSTMETAVRKWGNSLALRIPRFIAVAVGLEDGTTADVRVERGAMVARPLSVSKKLSLDQLLRKVTKGNLHGEVSSGVRRGRETW